MAVGSGVLVSVGKGVDVGSGVLVGWGGSVAVAAGLNPGSVHALSKTMIKTKTGKRFMRIPPARYVVSFSILLRFKKKHKRDSKITF